MTDWNQAFAFDEPFQEAVAAFLSRGVVTKAEFDQMSAAMKAKSWTVANVFAADEVQRIFEAAGASLEKGWTYAEFSKATQDILTSPWHRETVFRTSVLSGYGGGHWQQAWETKDLRPYVIYRDTGDGRVRSWHRLGGLVMPLDHPFVQSHWCPWEWN